jgi:NAD(P)-dependent dehydrogenase (short-subunit alcohol dehydrogenase family)
MASPVNESKPPFPEQHLDKPGIESQLEPRPAYQAPAYRAAGKLEGKTALITGGDSGIGRAVALLYAREGANVAIVHLPQEQPDAQEAAEEIKKASGRDVLLIAGDVTQADFCQQAVNQTLETFGALNILINNAGYQQHRTFDSLSLEQWDHTFKVNIYGYFYMVKAAVPHMSAGSAIINTGSITGLRGSAHLLDYSSTKGAIHAFTKALAQNLLERGIRVNCVAPGPVWTPLNPADRPADEVAEFGSKAPMQRPAQPEEIAPAYVFFASEADSSYITGEVLTELGGGTTAG